jgi:hypothetical protein
VPRTQSQRALARRAAPQERRTQPVRLRTGALNAGLATLAVSVLGLGVAASALSTTRTGVGVCQYASTVRTSNPDGGM